MNAQTLFLLIDSVLDHKDKLPEILVQELISLQDAAMESGINYG